MSGIPTNLDATDWNEMTMLWCAEFSNEVLIHVTQQPCYYAADTI